MGERALGGGWGRKRKYTPVFSQVNCAVRWHNWFTIEESQYKRVIGTMDSPVYKEEKNIYTKMRTNTVEKNR